MFITPIPTPGSSGGPIIDLEDGAVVGVVKGSRMDNRVAGLKGWATSAESIYEVIGSLLSLFSLQTNQLTIVDVPLAWIATKKLSPISHICIFLRSTSGVGN
jgi:S1-C subfamily serine protease